MHYSLAHPASFSSSFEAKMNHAVHPADPWSESVAPEFPLPIIGNRVLIRFASIRIFCP
jgi:hypothetical protein